MSDNLFWRNRIVDSGAADPQELAKGYNPDNWRHHPQIQRDALEDALDSIGVLQPVLFNRLSGKVIDGHLRIELAILKGQPLIPVNYVELTDDEEALALATLDAITEQAEPIADKLAALLERTRAMTADRPGLGAMLERLKERAGINGHQKTEETGPPPIDKAAELQKVWGVKVGDVWELGQHRLVCGDCTDRATVEAVMRGERADMVWTDPPYGVKIIGGTHNPFLPSFQSGKSIENDDLSAGQLEQLLRAAFENVYTHCRNGAAWYVTAPAGPLHLVFGKVLNELEIWHQTLQWLKHAFVFGRNDYHYRNEPIFYGWKPGAAHFFIDDRTQDTIWEFDRPGPTDKTHPTVKPIGLVGRAIENSSQEGEVIIDPFLGSGTTLIACEQLGRRCRGVEIDSGYCAVTLERWSQLTGQTPRRVSG